jgi:hypothetical protein
MAAKVVKVKAKDYEDLSDANIQRVIAGLEAEQPISKKDACNMLNIAYNTTRLTNIITEYKERQERDKRIRSEKRKQATTIDDVSWLVKQYLVENLSITEIAKNMYWSTNRVLSVLDEYGIPRKPVGAKYALSRKETAYVPDSALSDEFAVGELVYSMKYNCLARVKAEFKSQDEFKVYRVYLDGNYQEYAYQPVYDLASLKHLTDKGISI